VRGVRRADPRRRAVHLVRAALVLAAVLSAAAYARSYAPIYDPVGNARYLHCLLVSTPAFLWPVAVLLRNPARVLRVAVGGVLAVAAAFVVWAVVAAAVVVPLDRDTGRLRAELITTLERDGITRVRSDYWTCHWLTFLSRERIVCAVLNDDLTPGFDRDPRWATAVRADPDAPYLGRFYTVFDANLRAGLRARNIPVTQVELNGWWLYRPV
jgi:hypothetical protein